MFFPDRDLQCDFNSDFWEESECSWKFSQPTLTALSLGTGSRLTKIKVEGTEVTEPLRYWNLKTHLFGKKEI